MGATERLFNSIVMGDRSAVAKILAEEDMTVDRRDHVGRTPLQVAILAKEEDIACDLVDAGARMTLRLVDGRTALHLAAQADLPVVVRKLLERSAMNAEKAKEEEAAAKKAQEEAQKTQKEEAMTEDGPGVTGGNEDDDDDEHESSEDDWSSEDDSDKGKGDTTQKPAHDASLIPEDEEDVPDVFDVNLPDWDYGLTPLHYAIVFGSLPVMDELLAAGADPKLATQADRHSEPLHPLTVTTFTRDVDVACSAAKKLIASGAISSEADDNLFTIFHKIVCASRPALVETLLNHDPNAKAVLDSPHMVTYQWQAMFPIVSAIAKGDHVSAAILLAYGAKISLSEDHFQRARELK